MYVYKAAKARSKGLDAVWADVDLANVDINTLYTTYAKVILTLTHSAYTHDLYLDMDTARAQVAPSLAPRTVSQWLTSLGATTLPTLNSEPIYTERYVRYADAWEAGYAIEPVDRKRAWNAQIPNSDKNDLLLSRQGVDFTTLWKYCMISVNGLFHRVGGAPEGLYVVEGGRSGRTANDNHVGLLSFRDVGTLDYIPIMPGMLYKSHPSQTYGDYVNVKLPAPVEGKTLLLVLGGYLHILDNVYTQTGAQSVRINMANYPLAERVFESFDNIRMDTLGLTAAPNNPRQFVKADLYSDAAVAAYCTLPQSFFVVVDAPYLFAHRTDVEKADLPGRFVTQMPMDQLPLFGPLGRNLVYKPIPEWGRTVLACGDAIDIDYNFNTTTWQDNLSLDDTAYSAKPWDFARGYLLRIGHYTT